MRVIRRVAGCAASLRTLLNLKRHPPLAVRSKLHTLCLDDPGCSRRAQPPDAESRMSGGVGGLTGAIRSDPPAIPARTDSAFGGVRMDATPTRLAMAGRGRRITARRDAVSLDTFMVCA